MIFDILLVLGVGVLATALRTIQTPAVFRVGTLGLVFTSFLAGWLLGGSVLLGMVFASTWFLLPWLEILTRIRKLRLPLHRALEKSPPPPTSRFPGFVELTEELEALGFEHADDVDWRHDDLRQFYRLFYGTAQRTAAAICLVEQGQFSFFYVSFTSRAEDGRNIMTWNYPFSYGMHLLPDTIANRVDEDLGIEALAARHREFLEKTGVLSPGLAARDPADLRPDFERELRRQIEHNITRGILARDGEELIRYSVRGWFFLWGQFLREFVKFG